MVPARYVIDTDTWSILHEINNVVINDTDSVTITMEPGVLGEKWNNLFAMDVPDGDEDFSVTARRTAVSTLIIRVRSSLYSTRMIPIPPQWRRRYHSGLMPDHPESFGVMSTSTAGTSNLSR